MRSLIVGSALLIAGLAASRTFSWAEPPSAPADALSVLASRDADQRLQALERQVTELAARVEWLESRQRMTAEVPLLPAGQLAPVAPAPMLVLPAAPRRLPQQEINGIPFRIFPLGGEDRDE